MPHHPARIIKTRCDLMEYRKLPRGSEMISAVGLGFGGIQKASDAEIEAVVRKAVDNGINFFDMCAGASNVYAPFGRAIKDIRDKVMFQLHFGAIYNEKGEYGWTTDADRIKQTFEWEMQTLGTDYIDFGFLHCLDQIADFEKMKADGVLDLIRDLKKQGVVRHIGFSSHTPEVANRIIDEGDIDLMMFSINPAYDFEQGDEYGIGTASERAELFRRCQANGVAISVMKPFHGGKLLSEEASPFKKAMTHSQLIRYSLDRPGVITTLPGVRGIDDLDIVLKYLNATEEETDYGFIGGLNAEKVRGTCVYCNHCRPCPAGIDIGLVNKYYDLAKMGDGLAIEHYRKLAVNASDCVQCGHCDGRCPFSVEQSVRMQEIKEYFDSL